MSKSYPPFEFQFKKSYTMNWASKDKQEPLGEITTEGIMYTKAQR